jgi:hypothetical protein
VEHENRLIDAKNRIATRTEVAEHLSKQLKDAEPQYVASIASTLSKVMGYEAPTRSQVEIRTVPPSVQSWMDSLNTIEVQPLEQLTDCEQSSPPKALSPKGSG